MTKYVVVAGYCSNDTHREELIQAIGVYDNDEQAYGVAILHLNEFADADKGEMITPIYQLEGETGTGMAIKHEKITDYCYILPIAEEGSTDENTK